VKPSVILDAGPLVAFINARDANHEWTVARLKELSGPMLTCEAVLSEAVFLLRTINGGTTQVAGMLRSGGLRITFSLESETSRVCDLLVKYADVPMSLADACLVRMSEIYSRHLVMTFDSDFNVYRRNRRQSIPRLSP
jgi:uncharacterized protein